MSIQRIIQLYGREYLRKRPDLAKGKQWLLKDLAGCQTGAFGTHVLACEDCGWQQTRANSCRNRHCATCSAAARAKWFDQLQPKLLPTSYLQVVFTLPHELIPLTLTQGRVLYRLLFQTAWATLQQLAADPRYLGARIGATAVLHTWNQELQPHPHVHFVMPAGGLSPDGSAWIPFRRGKAKDARPGLGDGELGAFYLFPHKVLSRLFRGKFLAALRAVYDSQELVRQRLPERWQAPEDFASRCRELSSRDWVVYQQSPPPDLPPEALVKYLARYVSGVAISDRRLVSCEQGEVQFTVKNRSQGGRREVRAVSAGEFLSRFLQHILPRGFTRVRHYGFLSSGNASQREHCRTLIVATASSANCVVSAESEPGTPPATVLAAAPSAAVSAPALIPTLIPESPTQARAMHLLCASCERGRLRMVEHSPIPHWLVRWSPLGTSPAASRLKLRVSPAPAPAPVSGVTPAVRDSS